MMQQPNSLNDLEFTVSDPNAPPSSGSLDLQGPMQQQPQQASANNNNDKKSVLAASAHPCACVFHCLFKAAALFLYIFGGLFVGKSSANFITVTVLCILLLAADFWVVKNITGRLLVGLRWWNQVDGDSTKWIFESRNQQAVNKFDHSVFWTVLYATPLIWSFLLVIGILKFEVGWLLIVFMALGLSGSNVVGYYKCSSDQKAKFQQMMVRGAEAGALSAIRSNLFGFLVRGGGGGGGSNAGGAGVASTTYV